MRRRWFVRILVGLLALVAIFAITVEVVLQTDLPRKLVLAQLESTLQLRFGAKSVHTGWTGRTTLSDVSLSLPLANNAFLNVKTLRVKHTALPALLVGRSLTVSSLEFDEPELFIEQFESGRWNVIQAVDLVRRALGGKQAADTAEPKKPDLAAIPAVVLRDGVVHVIDRTGRAGTLRPLNLDAQPEGRLVWRYDLRAGGTPDRPQMGLVGKLVPGGEWFHQVTIAARGEGPWLSAWLPSDAVRAVVDRSTLEASWSGRVTANGGLAAQVQVKELTAGGVVARGALNADYANGVLTARPQNLELSGLPMLSSGLLLESGVIAMEGSAVRAENVTATVAAGRARVNGHYDWQAGSADLTANWSQLQLPAGYNQNGSLNFTLRTNWPGVLRVDGQLASAGVSPGGSWDSTLSLTGSGNTFQTIEWQLAADKLRVKRPTIDANLDHLTAKLANARDVLTLTELSVPAGQLTPDRPRGTLRGGGHYRWPVKGTPHGGEWDLSVSGEGWRVFTQRDVTADFNLDATGDLNAPGKLDWAKVDELYASTSAGVRFWAGGSISYAAPGKPADLWLYSWYPPFTLEGYDKNEALRAGEFRSGLHVRGAAWPMGLDVDGTLEGASVAIGGRPVGDVSMKMTGRAQATKDARDWTVDLKTEHIKLFEGDWDVDGDYSSATDQGTFRVALRQMSMTALDQFVSPPPNVGGTVSGNWVVRVPHMRLKESLVDGPWQAMQVRAPRFVADTITGELHTTPQRVLVNHVRAIRKAGGQIDAELGFAIATPSQLEVKATAAAWPLELPQASLTLYAQTPQPITIDFKSGQVRGPAFKLDAYPVSRGINLGVIRTEGSVAGHTVTLTKIDGDAFGGRLTGTASYNVDKLLDARAKLEFVDVDGAQVEAFLRAPELATTRPATRPTTRATTRGTGGRRAATRVAATRPASLPSDLATVTATDLRGRFSGAIALGTPTRPHPLGPLELRLRVAAKDGWWRMIDIVGADGTAYYDPGADAAGTGEERFVLDDSAVAAADGTIRLFARTTRHPLVLATPAAAAAAATQPVAPDVLRNSPADWSFNLLVDADDLVLNHVIDAVSPDAKDQPGRLKLHFTLIGNPRDRQRWVGEGSARLTQADLAQNGVIAGLYEVMHLKVGAKNPTGRGSTTFRFEGDDLNVTSFYYFNSGLEARGTGRLLDVWSGPAAKLDAYIVGSIRPLKDLKLPFAPDVDKVLSVLQANVTPVRVEGPVHSPKVKLALFGDIGRGLRELLLGDVRGETRNTAE